YSRRHKQEGARPVGRREHLDEPSDDGGEMTESNAYRAALDGCDDYSSAVTELADAEVRLLKRLEEKVNRVATSGCQPCLSVRAAMMDDITEYHEILNEIEGEG